MLPQKVNCFNLRGPGQGIKRECKRAMQRYSILGGSAAGRGFLSITQAWWLEMMSSTRNFDSDWVRLEIAFDDVRGPRKMTKT